MRGELKRACECYLKGAELNRPKSLYMLGACYWLGIKGVVEVDNKKALDYYMKSVDLGYPMGYFRIGTAYFYGELGLPKDYEKALEWYDKALAAGEKPDRVYSSKTHVYEKQNDPKNALIYYEKAAELGDVMSMVSLGNMYMGGEAGAIDYAKARTWLEKAVEKQKDYGVNYLYLIYI